MIDQHGERKRFFSDVLKNKLVLISFFYTSCTAACPLINQKLAAVQDLLGERLGKDVFMISLTTDPESDTPEVLKSYAARFGARDGWVFLTGAKTDVKKILDRLGNVFPVREQHLTYLILGDVAAARWRKIQANIPEEAIAGWVTALADERE